MTEHDAEKLLEAISKQVADVTKDVKSRHAIDIIFVAALPTLAIGLIGAFLGTIFIGKAPEWMQNPKIGIGAIFVTYITLLAYAVRSAFMYRRGWQTSYDSGGILVAVLFDRVLTRLKDASTSVQAAETALERKMEPFLVSYAKSRQLERGAQTVMCVTKDLEWASLNISEIIADVKDHPINEYKYLVFLGASEESVNAVNRNIATISRHLKDQPTNIRSRIAIKLLCLSGSEIRALPVLYDDDAVALSRTMKEYKNAGLRMPLFSDLVLYDQISTVPTKVNGGEDGAPTIASRRVSSLAVISSTPLLDDRGEQLADNPKVDYAFCNITQHGSVRTWFEACWRAT